MITDPKIRKNFVVKHSYLALFGCFLYLNIVAFLIFHVSHHDLWPVNFFGEYIALLGRGWSGIVLGMFLFVFGALLISFSLFILFHIWKFFRNRRKIKKIMTKGGDLIFCKSVGYGVDYEYIFNKCKVEPGKKLEKEVSAVAVWDPSIHIPILQARIDLLDKRRIELDKKRIELEKEIKSITIGMIKTSSMCSKT